MYLAENVVAHAKVLLFAFMIKVLLPDVVP